MLPSRTLSMFVNRSPDDVYRFISGPENLPKWAAGLCKSVSRSQDGWMVETAQGPMRIRFAGKNDFGVADHYVSSAPDVEIHVPIRVLANGSGSEVILTLFRLPDMSDAKYAEDVDMVERDLLSLKRVLEDERS